MGRGPKWGREMSFWGCETNWLDKSDIAIFVKFTKIKKVDLQ